ncbi:MAG: glycosyltransferase family 2 protein [Pirellulaceae bacterium]|nr:glycosyltransferase family 2 protein [Pirellulaceae bacterium]
MQVSGFSVVRNAVRYDYPFLESLRSLLPLVDELVLAVGDCDDGTIEALATLNSPKLKVLHTVWDPAIRSGGLIISQQTNLALDACQGDWCFYLQADEILHENDLDRIDSAMRKYVDRPQIDGLTFRYHHFRADYFYRDPLPYRRQTRIVRRTCGARSYGDGCGFRIADHKLRTASTGAWVYHYGHVKPPRNMSAKMDYFCSLYDGRQVQPGSEASGDTFGWDVRSCEPFRGTHPQVMAARVAAQDWSAPPCKLTPRWRNQHYYAGLAYKNSRALRRWAGKLNSLLGRKAG